MGVSRKNIYRVGKQEPKDILFKEEIEKVHLNHPSYGHKRVALHLDVNHKKTARVMKKYDIHPPRRRKRGFFTTRSVSGHHYTNLIKDISPVLPHHVWCADLSYLKFQGKFWYLSDVEDMVTRQVLSIKIGNQHNSQLVVTTLKQALTKATPLIFHSDQGSEFMANTSTNYLEERGVKISVSDKASPWQNGYQESFFGRFKEEFGDPNRFETIGELIEEVYSQTYYYNHHRIHTSLKMPPAVYAKQKYSDYCLQERGT